MILFVRHGETDCNKQGIIQGQLDAPLNEEGIKQAEETAEKLKNTEINVIYSSPLVRAKLTAEIINKYHNVDIICDDRLKEQNAGEATGRYESSITKEEYEYFAKDPHKYNAESEEDLYIRNIDFFKEIEKSDKTILIVAHRGIYKNLYRYINNLSLSDKVAVPGNSEVKTLKD